MELKRGSQSFIFLLLRIFDVTGNSFMNSGDTSLICEALDGLGSVKTFPKSSIIDIVSKSKASSEFNILTFNCLIKWIVRKDYVFTTSNNQLLINSSFVDSRKKRNTALILESHEALKPFLENMSRNNSDFHGRYIIFITQASAIELESMFNLLWRRFIYNVNILLEANNSVEMFTFFPFSEDGECHKSKSVKINSFVNGSWTNDSFFTPKLRNFHKCPLKAACFEYGPSAQQTIHSNGSVTLNGSDIEILNGLAEILNADLEVSLLTAVGSWGQVWENGSAVGAFKSIIEKKIDICANFYYLTDLRSKFMQYTTAYYSISLMVMIPRGPPFSPLQKLLRPFEAPVWAFLSVFMLICFLAVAIIKFHSKRAQILFFDRNINSPIVEMMVIMRGGSQHILPRKSFSRLLMMSFVMYCFVFRSIYEGSIYKFLQSDGRMKDFETISSLIDEDFEFYMDPGLEHMLEHAKFYTRKRSFVPEDYDRIQLDTLDPYSKGALVTSNDEVIHLNKRNQKNFTFNVLNELIMTVPVVFYLQKDSYLTEIINEKIFDLKSAGLIDYWILKYLDSKYLRVKKAEQRPRNLNLRELLGAFQLCCVGLACSIVVFLLEIVVNIIRNRRRRYKPSN